MTLARSCTRRAAATHHLPNNGGGAHEMPHLRPTNPARKILGDAILKPELVEQRPLIAPLPPHPPRCRRSISHRNHGLQVFSSLFSTASVKPGVEDLVRVCPLYPTKRPN